MFASYPSGDAGTYSCNEKCATPVMSRCKLAVAFVSALYLMARRTFRCAASIFGVERSIQDQACGG